MSSTSFSATWHIVIVYVEVAILMPLYFVILMAIRVNRNKDVVFQSHYYTLVISQGLADFVNILIFAPVTIARTYSLGNSFLYDLDNYGAARLLVTGAPYILITRCVGVTLITVQRFSALCRPHSWTQEKIEHLPSFCVCAFHWFLSLLIYTPGFICSQGSYFENEETLFIVSSETFAKVSPLCVVISFFLCSVVTISLYVVIVKFLYTAKKIISTASQTSRMTRSNEIRLCFHVLLLTLVGIMILLYWLAELLFGGENERAELREIRTRYPLISGNYTFINPVVLLILNRDVQRVLRKAVCRKRIATVPDSEQTLGHRTHATV